ncbi:protein-L-isoaspartate(D-aspartate) O-methyltransferase [Caldithrix abyssi]|nr:protein-L-isoaspartate(D-aspartate) O-methyltransferase [Caldithrix abyssi]APF17424.1 pcm protein-L-isoaspartate(D-aspartate) O-methyltransferase [Caldithrix abyssi DSM 13497]
MKKNEDYYAKLRKQMVEQQIIARGVKDPAVIRAMESVPRHLFVPESEMAYAYLDEPRPIGHGQTISQPYIVAFMTEQLHLKPTDRVLEIGTGSGYQAAVLAEIVDSVYTIEIVPELARIARERLQELGYDNVQVKQGDGYNGWPEKAPFDAIIVTAAPPNIPPPLLEQLKIGGVMVLPVGEYVQELVVVQKSEEGISMRNVLPVRFVPMTGKVQQSK